jgi:hypothetical protein
MRGWLAILPLAIFPLLHPSVARAQGDLATSTSTSTQDEAAPCDRSGVSTLFTCTWHDVRQVAGGESRTWLAVGASLAIGSAPLDDRLSESMRDGDPDPGFAPGRHLGEAALHFGVPAAMYVGARITGHPDTAGLAVTMLRTQVVNGILTRSLKLIPRRRPNQDAATLTKGSFPSGHTSAAFATATIIQRRWGWTRGVPAYLVAAYVGTTRLQNLHYLSDVTFGAALGIASGLTVKMPGDRVVVSPMIAPGVRSVRIEVRSRRTD